MTKHIEGLVERISLHYPGIDRDDLSLRSEDGVLFVGLNGREREVVTSVPTKASQVKAKLEGDVLHLDVPLDEA
jgi:HSP20 family molecular chaperone IbpA